MNNATHDSRGDCFARLQRLLKLDVNIVNNWCRTMPQWGA